MKRLKHENKNNNFVIHGAEEIGDSPAEKLKNDKKSILDILEQIGFANSKPKYTMSWRREKRGVTTKEEMKIKEDKENKMSNLKFLKGRENYFLKTRITDDYTRNEKDLIRDMVKKRKKRVWMTQTIRTMSED